MTTTINAETTHKDKSTPLSFAEFKSLKLWCTNFEDHTGPSADSEYYCSGWIYKTTLCNILIQTDNPHTDKAFVLLMDGVRIPSDSLRQLEYVAYRNRYLEVHNRHYKPNPKFADEISETPF